MSCDEQYHYLTCLNMIADSFLVSELLRLNLMFASWNCLVIITTQLLRKRWSQCTTFLMPSINMITTKTSPTSDGLSCLWRNFLSHTRGSSWKIARYVMRNLELTQVMIKILVLGECSVLWCEDHVAWCSSLWWWNWNRTTDSHYHDERRSYLLGLVTSCYVGRCNYLPKWYVYHVSFIF